MNVARTPWAAACWRRYSPGARPKARRNALDSEASLEYPTMRAICRTVLSVALVRDHPFVERGGSLQVTEAVSP